MATKERDNGKSSPTAEDTCVEAPTVHQSPFMEENSLELLLGGHPQSFIDFINIVQHHNKDARCGSPTSQEESINMVTVRSLLTTAEDLVKDERHHEAAQHYIEIAEYNSPHRYPVDGYYLQSYLHNGGDVAAGLYLYCRSITLANAPALAAQAYYKMGMAKSKVSDLQQGIVTLERALALTTDTSEGSSLGPVIAKDLAKLYMRLAVDSDLLALCVEEAGHPQNDEYCKVALVVAGREWSAITCYERALECAKLSLDEAVEGIASYKLGAARLDSGNLEEARTLHQRYLDISQRLDDRKGQAAARAMLSTIYQRLGDEDAAINQLEQLRVVAEDAGEITTAADACLNLAVLSYKEDEVKATELLESYYQLSCRADNRDRRDTAAVLLAFANGRHIIPHVADIFKERRGIHELLRRKDTCMTNSSHANT